MESHESTPRPSIATDVDTRTASLLLRRAAPGQRAPASHARPLAA